MSLKTLNDAFVDELKDVLSAEKQLLRALPKMAKAAGSEELRAAIEHHLKETQTHVDRLETAFESIDLAPRSKKCDAMAGILEEADGILEEEAEAEVRDALIIAAAQKVEHYEIATYGTLCTWATLLGHKTALKYLKQTINEEELADKKLSEIARKINVEAMEPMIEE